MTRHDVKTHVVYTLDEQELKRLCAGLTAEGQATLQEDDKKAVFFVRKSWAEQKKQEQEPLSQL